MLSSRHFDLMRSKPNSIQDVFTLRPINVGMVSPPGCNNCMHAHCTPSQIKVCSGMGFAAVLEAALDPMGSKATLLAATGERTTAVTIQYVLVYKFVVVRAYCLPFW